jgi:hypothetical protein
MSVKEEKSSSVKRPRVTGHDSSSLSQPPPPPSSSSSSSSQSVPNRTYTVPDQQRILLNQLDGLQAAYDKDEARANEREKKLNAKRSRMEPAAIAAEEAEIKRVRDDVEFEKMGLDSMRRQLNQTCEEHAKTVQQQAMKQMLLDVKEQMYELVKVQARNYEQLFDFALRLAAYHRLGSSKQQTDEVIQEMITIIESRPVLVTKWKDRVLSLK